MPDLNFSFGGGGGFGSLPSIPTFNAVSSSSPTVTGNYTGQPGNQSSSGLPSWLTWLTETGLGAWRTKLSSDLANRQVDKGQSPSVVPTVGGTQTLGNVVSSATSFLPLLVVVFVIVLLVKLLAGGKR